MLPRCLAHEVDRRTIRNLFDHSVPSSRLLCAEVRARKDLLHAENLDALARGFGDQLEMLLDRLTLDRFERRIRRRSASRLNQSATNVTSQSALTSSR